MTVQIPQGSKNKYKRSKSKLAPENQAMEITPKQQRREANQSDLNNQLQHQEIPSQPKLP